MLLVERSAISRTLTVVALVVVVAAIAGGALLLGGSGSSGSGPILIQIIETDPVNQVDSLSPVNVTVTHDTTVTLAVQNHDDAPRSFEISALNVNQTVGSGATERITITVGSPGVYQIYIPPRPPFDGFKASPSMTGYLVVT